jgi:sucrose-6-phosphate hydrolase SacC (GH32 family)
MASIPHTLRLGTTESLLHTYYPKALCSTGVDNFTEYGYYYQTQAMATPRPLPPSNPDPLLTHWTKSAQNPIISNPPLGGSHSQFRDPTTSWQQV